MSTNKKVPLLRYWTKRYFIILLCSLAVTAFLSGWWIRNTLLENRLRVFELFAQDVAEQLGNFDLTKKNGTVQKKIRQRARLFYKNRPFGKDVAVYIVNANGKMIFENNKSGNEEIEQFLLERGTDSSESTTQTFKTNDRTVWYQIGNPIIRNGNFIGTIYFSIPKAELTAQKDRKDYLWMGIFLMGLGFSGWLVIYLLSRKLTDPIRKVAYAAGQVSKGNYDIQIEENMPEKELHELSVSFTNMAMRLKQLEELRTVLLAGVTHELKTPVTAIGGCIQAVKEGVVKGEEAEEFLSMSLQEVKRLQTMVDELLDFNAFASGVVQIQCTVFSLNDLLMQTVQKWQVIDKHASVPLQVQVPKETRMVYGDPNRTQQIVLNLLNNAKEAVRMGGEIEVILYERDESYCEIDVTDTGAGIQLEEQELIFERFYRGKDLNYKKRGLGLGLPLSKMLAQAQGGDLLLKKSVPGEGSTFTLLLKKS